MCSTFLFVLFLLISHGQAEKENFAKIMEVLVEQKMMEMKTEMKTEMYIKNLEMQTAMDVKNMEMDKMVKDLKAMDLKVMEMNVRSIEMDRSTFHDRVKREVSYTYSCYNWTEKEKIMITIVSLATQQSYCEEDLGNKWTYGDDSLAPGCGKCWCCKQSESPAKNLPEADQVAAGAPLGVILAWVPKPSRNSSVVSPLPDGWLPCDGRRITQGPWAGGVTPDLNTAGRFLRGGTEGEALQMQEHQIQRHLHDDNGHSHGCSASSTASSHNHGCSASSKASSHSHTYQEGYNADNSDVGTICGTASGCSDPDPFEYKQTNTGSNTVSVSTSCNTSSSTVPVSTTCKTSLKTSGIGNVSPAARSGAETRPLNMKVVFIMKCWEKSTRIGE